MLEPGFMVTSDASAFLRRDLLLLARVGRRRALETLTQRRFRGEMADRPTCAYLMQAGV